MVTSPRPKKSLGQHFLRHRDICENIVRLLRLEPGDRVMEIGPGPGALTNILETAPLAELVLLEKDRHWAAERQRNARAKGARTQTVLTDALSMLWERVTPERPWKIIGNLPYNVASPLMWDIFSRASGLILAVFMVQKEVGLRLAAPPGGKDYGALTVWTRSFVRPRWEFAVGSRAFVPPPKVDSAVLSFTPRPPEERPAHPAALARLIKMCFQNRRKQLGSIFRQNNIRTSPEFWEELSIPPHVRPETLTPEDFFALLRASSHNLLDFTG